jgi:hypothetical protein
LETSWVTEATSDDRVVAASIEISI